MAFECKRYFDLNRRGIVEEVIQQQLDYMNLKFPVNKMITHPVTGKPYYLYPIPATEFVNNAKLGEQNPGYK
ncbi:MAG: RagB/SusD family nutrient uptake outer membrane protein [Tannerella sp.]|nr:RagB/SusD family nutrient uptake outer membrane protein [Tannerella sp.]